MNRTHTTAVLAAIAGLAATAHAQTAYTWAAATDGLWDIAANWSPNTAFPDLDGDTAVLGLTGAYAVDLDRTVEVTTLDITNPDASLEIRGANRLQAYDRVTNDGFILVNSTGSVFDAFLEFLLSGTAPVANFTLNGSGLVRLGASGSHGDARLAVDAGLELFHGPDHTIDGTGQIQGEVLNAGLILANTPASIGIRIMDTVTQTGAGSVMADAADIVLNSGTISGGDIFTVNGGALTMDASPSTLAGVPNVSGAINIPGGGFTLEIDGDATVNGDITVNSSLQVFNATLRFTQSSTLSGDADILLQVAGTDTADARVDTADGFVASLGPDVDITGAGRMTGAFNVAGSIDASSEGELLEIFDSVSLVGSGVIRASGGQLGLNSATISSANFESTAPGRVLTTGGASLLSGSALNSGTIAIIGSGHTLESNSVLTNNGVIQLNPDLTVFNSTLLLSGAPVINGAGVIEMYLAGAGGDTNDAKIEAAEGVTANLGPGQTVMGEGRLVGDFMSNAHILANSPLNPLELRGSMVQGSGVIEGDAAVFALVNGSVTGGTLTTSNDGLVTAASGADNAIADLTNSGDLGVDGTGAVLTASGTIVNNGRILLNRTGQVFNASLDLADGAMISGTGEINLAAAGSFEDARIRVVSGAATIGPDQTITGTGRMADAITIQGTIAPGESVGEIQYNSGLMTLAPTSVFEVELAGADGASHDRISGNADHVIDGALNVTEIGGYLPAVGDEYVLIDGTSVTGEFDTVTLPSTLPNRVYRLFYESDRVVLVHTCDGDFAPPYDVLDFSDVLAFLTAFSAGDSLVDLAPPLGVFDFSDVIAFLTAFGSGCP